MWLTPPSKPTKKKKMKRKTAQGAAESGDEEAQIYLQTTWGSFRKWYARLEALFIQRKWAFFAVLMDVSEKTHSNSHNKEPSSRL
jgi:hypothetical protein